MELKDSVQYKLLKPVEYTLKGDTATAELLVMYAPNSHCDDARIQLNQGFMQAVTAIQRPDVEAVADTDAKIKGSDIIALLMSSSIDMVEYFKIFRSLICSQDICKLEDNAQLKPLVYDSLHYEDKNRMLGEYLANFILSSQLEELTK